MKTLSSYVTRSNAFKATLLIIGIHAYLLVTSPLYAAFLAVCSIVLLIIVFRERNYKRL